MSETLETLESATQYRYGAAVARFERRSEWPMAVLAVLFLVCYAWPILQPSLTPSVRRACAVIDYVIWLAFAVEFVWRVALARSRARYIAWHIPDVLMIALPVLRPLRLLRLLVLLRMLNRWATANLRGRVVTYVMASAALILFCSALAVLDAERHDPHANIQTFGDAVWWAAATMTTVGYGDRTPITGEGRAVGFALMLAGIALLGVVTASLASWLIERVREIDSEAEAATRGDIATLRAEVAQLRQALANAAVIDPRSLDG